MAVVATLMLNIYSRPGGLGRSPCHQPFLWLADTRRGTCPPCCPICWAFAKFPMSGQESFPVLRPLPQRPALFRFDATCCRPTALHSHSKHDAEQVAPSRGRSSVHEAYRIELLCGSTGGRGGDGQPGMRLTNVCPCCTTAPTPIPRAHDSAPRHNRGSGDSNTEGGLISGWPHTSGALVRVPLWCKFQKQPGAGHRSQSW